MVVFFCDILGNRVIVFLLGLLLNILRFLIYYNNFQLEFIIHFHGSAISSFSVQF